MKLDQIIATRPKKTIYRDGDSVIKVFEASYAKSAVLNEALNMARMEETGIEMPHLREVCMADGKWAIVSEFVAGTTLTELMAGDPLRYRQYLTRMVDVQLHIQSYSHDGLMNLNDKLHQRIRETELDAACRYALRTRIASLPNQNRICHGDIRPSNLIITPENKAFVLDWAHVTQGSGAADAAHTWLYFVLKGDQPHADEYLSLFSKKGGVPQEVVMRWVPVIAAADSVHAYEEDKGTLLDFAKKVLE